MRKIENRVGETLLNNFGSTMIITAYRKYSDIDVYFPEYDWTAKHARYGNFIRGNIKCCYEPRVFGVGYLGEGPYKAYENGKITKEYRTWGNMLMRCYDPKYHEKEPTYKDCYVCKEWLDFQTFSVWYKENFYEIDGEAMNLDKDILVKGNKIYSPETCVFVPQTINKLFIKSDAMRGDLPIGVYFRKDIKKYVAQCNTITNRKNLGHYNTPEEAFQAYKTFKEAYIKKLANDYIEDISFNLYQAMIDYEVEIDD